MVKLQLLLRHPAALPELDPGLRARLEALGMRVTGSGRASVSVEAAPEVAQALLGVVPAAQSGFGLLSAPALKVPPALADAISSISIAPHHATHVPT